jgi:hypothetical protein
VKTGMGRREGSNVNVGLFIGRAEHILVRQKVHVV